MTTIVSTASSVTPAPRRYPRRRLQGPVTVWFSNRVKYPKLHLVRDCEGLEHTPDEAVSERTYLSARDLAVDVNVRPCRLCALESVLYSSVDVGDRSPTRSVFFTSTSQGSPASPDLSPATFAYSTSTESGEARLARIARRFGLPVTTTSAGLVTWGWTDPVGASILSTNLRTVSRAGFDVEIDADVVHCAWSLLNDLPPELSALRGEEPAIDALDTARALLA